MTGPTPEQIADRLRRLYAFEMQYGQLEEAYVTDAMADAVLAPPAEAAGDSERDTAKAASERLKFEWEADDYGGFVCYDNRGEGYIGQWQTVDDDGWRWKYRERRNMSGQYSHYVYDAETHLAILHGLHLCYAAREAQ